MEPLPDPDWTVFEALRAARRRERGPFLRAAMTLRLGEQTEFPLRTHLWLAAESAFVVGQYGLALERFQAWLDGAEHDPAPGWMHCIAPLHACRSAQRLGRFSVAKGLLARAEDVVRDQSPSSLFEGETEALGAHQIEAEGTSEVAKLRFVFAYELAIRHKNWKAGIEIAYDIGRIQTRLRNWADAHHWLSEAQRLLEHHENALFRRKIEVRLAQLERSARRFKPARARLMHVIESLTPAGPGEPDRPYDATMPDVLMFAFSAMHEMHLVNDDFASAESCLVKARELADSRGLLPTAVDVRRDQAMLHMFWSDTILDAAGLLESHRSALSRQRLEASRQRRRLRSEKNMLQGTGVKVPTLNAPELTPAQQTATREAAEHRSKAREHFAEALDVVGRMNPAPTGRLTAIAVDLRSQSELLPPGHHSEQARQRIAAAYEEVKRLRPPEMHGQARRLRDRERAAAELADAIADATDGSIETAFARVRSRSQRIEWTGPALSEKKELTPDLFAILKAIAQHEPHGIEREVLMSSMEYNEANRANFSSQLSKLRAALGGASTILEGETSDGTPTLRLGPPIDAP